MHELASALGLGPRLRGARERPLACSSAAIQPAPPSGRPVVSAILSLRVDLLKLLDLDSSLAARKELGEELGVNAGEDGSAEQNIALHKAVMDKLAANGGVVPDDLRN